MSLNEIGVDRAHIISREFVESSDNLRKKFKLKEGGNHTIIFGKFIDDEEMVILTEKV